MQPRWHNTHTSSAMSELIFFLQYLNWLSTRTCVHIICIFIFIYGIRSWREPRINLVRPKGAFGYNEQLAPLFVITMDAVHVHLHFRVGIRHDFGYTLTAINALLPICDAITQHQTKPVIRRVEHRSLHNSMEYDACNILLFLESVNFIPQIKGHNHILCNCGSGKLYRFYIYCGLGIFGLYVTVGLGLSNTKR